MCSNWELRVLVTDLQVERTLLVRSDLHVGGVMIQLVDELGKHLPTGGFPININTKTRYLTICRYHKFIR